MDPPWVVTLESVEMREVFIEILTVGEGSQVVTVIEVLSPANKTAGSEGHRLYLTKQHEILASQTHLLEIDLLRRGEHSIAAPRDSVCRRGQWDYLTCLHHGGQGQRYEIWAVTVRQRLPRIAVLLAYGDADVALDLQAVFDRCYDEGAYARRIDYRHAPPVPLGEDDPQVGRCASAGAWAAGDVRHETVRRGVVTCWGMVGAVPETTPQTSR